MYHFLSGYTAKVAGTERGVTEPQATFSTCFGAPFMALPPDRVRQAAGGEDRAAQRRRCGWSTPGWTGGPYGVGHRMKIAHTRAMVHAALSGKLENVEMRADPIFGFQVPMSPPGRSARRARPAHDVGQRPAYDEAARKLAGMFAENFEQYVAFVPPEVRAAGMPGSAK